MPDLGREEKLICQFCKRVSEIERRAVNVKSWPDRESPGIGGCEAIIDKGGKLFALEHTSIDSFFNKRKDDHLFNKIVVPIEEEIHKVYPDLRIALSVPAKAAYEGHNFKKITKKLIEESIKVIPGIPDDHKLHKFDFNGVPFPVLISTDSNAERSGCLVSRTLNDYKEDMASDIARAIRTKRMPLLSYRNDSLSTILLLDSDDVALMNHHILADAFAKASEHENTDGIDEIYIAEADRDPIWFYPVKLYNRIYPDLPEFREYFEAQYAIDNQPS